MSFGSIFNGSLLSRERLLQAREFYEPQSATLGAGAAFARWTQRLSVQSELGGARELAGLSDAELAALEAEFERCPQRLRRDALRHAVPAGALLIALGALGLAVQALGPAVQGNGAALAQALCVAWLLAGACVLGAGFIGGFGAMHLELVHGTTGLMVGRLNEQHPWLYKALRLAANPPAEAYRQAVLRDRGSLRGIDCVLMQAIVTAHDALEATRPARVVAEQLQQPVPLPVPAAQPAALEPRVVRLASGAERRQRSAEPKEEEATLPPQPREGVV
jgi:hypothetical protein